MDDFASYRKSQDKYHKENNNKYTTIFENRFIPLLNEYGFQYKMRDNVDRMDVFSNACDTAIMYRIVTGYDESMAGNIDFFIKTKKYKGMLKIAHFSSQPMQAEIESLEFLSFNNEAEFIGILEYIANILTSWLFDWLNEKKYCDFSPEQELKEKWEIRMSHKEKYLNEEKLINRRFYPINWKI